MTLGIAAIGAGGQGAGDIRNAYNKGKNRVVALCDVDSSGGNEFPTISFSRRKVLLKFQENAC